MVQGEQNCDPFVLFKLRLPAVEFKPAPRNGTESIERLRAAHRGNVAGAFRARSRLVRSKAVRDAFGANAPGNRLRLERFPNLMGILEARVFD